MTIIIALLSMLFGILIKDKIKFNKKHNEEDRETKEKIERINKSFQAMMEYNEKIAIRGE